MTPSESSNFQLMPPSRQPKCKPPTKTQPALASLWVSQEGIPTQCHLGRNDITVKQRVHYKMYCQEMRVMETRKRLKPLSQKKKIWTQPLTPSSFVKSGNNINTVKQQMWQPQPVQPSLILKFLVCNMGAMFLAAYLPGWGGVRFNRSEWERTL